MSRSHLAKGWLVSAVLGLVASVALKPHVISPVYAWILGGWLALSIGIPLSLLAANRVRAAGDDLEQTLLGFCLRRRASVELVRLKWSGFVYGLRLYFSDGSVMRFPFVTQAAANGLGNALSKRRRG